MYLIFDSHLDLAFDALQIKRDLREEVETIRSRDDEATVKNIGTCTVTLPELRKGGVGIVCGTVMSRIDPTDNWTQTGMSSQTQCYGIGRGHAAYYEALERRGELSIIRSGSDLDAAVERWQAIVRGGGKPHPEGAQSAMQTAEKSASRPPARLGLIITMESADPIIDPDHVEEWHRTGLRMVGISHFGKNTYAHGTDTEGGLLPPAKPLLKALREHRIAVDLTHLSDRAFWEVLDVYDGPVAASHHNCRALVPGQRQLTDEMIKAIAERKGVIGTSFDSWMLDPEFKRRTPAGTQTTNAYLKTIADHIDHIARLTGTVDHCGIGSDLDGGFGKEQAPSDLDTIADVQKLSAILSSRGYSENDIEKIFSGNWIRFFKEFVF